jgi:hypothetical protein
MKILRIRAHLDLFTFHHYEKELTTLHQAGMVLTCVGNVSYLNLDQDIVVLTQYFHGFPQSIQTIVWMAP